MRELLDAAIYYVFDMLNQFYVTMKRCDPHLNNSVISAQQNVLVWNSWGWGEDSTRPGSIEHDM